MGPIPGLLLSTVPMYHRNHSARVTSPLPGLPRESQSRTKRPSSTSITSPSKPSPKQRVKAEPPPPPSRAVLRRRRRSPRPSDRLPLELHSRVRLTCRSGAVPSSVPVAAPGVVRRPLRSPRSLRASRSSRSSPSCHPPRPCRALRSRRPPRRSLRDSPGVAARTAPAAASSHHRCRYADEF